MLGSAARPGPWRRRANGAGDLVVAAEAPPARDSWAPPRKRLSLRASRRRAGTLLGQTLGPAERARPLSLPRPSIRIIE